MIFIRLLFILVLLSNIGLYIYSRQNIPQTTRFIAVDPGVDKLVLLSELDNENTIWEEGKSREQDNKDVVFNQECFSVGAFNSKSEISPVLEALKSDVIKIRSRKIISTQEAGYWVFIPALKTRQKALDIARKLSEAEISDYYVVTVGENENTISLGLYRDSQNADTRLQELLSRGFNAEKQVRVEQWPEFWLDYTIASDRVQSLANINDINPDVTSNKVECNW